MKFFHFTRYSEWWEPKIIPLLGVGYLVIYLNNYHLFPSILRLLFLIFSIIVGAIYVSVINDLSDIKEDAEAGKKNIMQNMSKWRTSLIIGFSYIIGLFNCYVIYPDKLSILFYIMAWVVFTFYSLPPFRLKKRGLWGVFADAMGAHLFPTLLIVCNLAYISDKNISATWIIIIILWSLFFGLRGILWHQFYDRDNDILTHTNTFASRIKPEDFKLIELLIFFIEILCFLFMIYSLFNIWMQLSIILYLLLIWIRKKVLNIQTIVVITPKNLQFRILMHDFYLTFFPLTILLNISLHQSYGWVLFCLQILLFPRPVYHVIKDFAVTAKLIVSKGKDSIY